MAILAPRQTGKTTLARQVAERYRAAGEGAVTHFDLEDPTDLDRLSEDPKLALGDLQGLVILDEIQRQPELFTILRVLADRRPRPARFLILGSASPHLLRQSSESLAGRIHYQELNGLGLGEIAPDSLDQRWLRGGFPVPCLADDDVHAFEWIDAFIRSFVERDLSELGFRTRSTTMRRFWTMLAHWHGQTWNGSEFGRSFGAADTTVRGYLDALTDALVVRQLQPWHANVAKRQVKAPKVYIRDSGLVHGLLQIGSPEGLLSHPKCGASWEGLILELIIDQLELKPDQAYYWATHNGAELSLFVPSRGRLGIEIKRTSSPKVTKSMRSAIQDLELGELLVIHAGEGSYPLAEGIRAVAARELVSALEPYRPRARAGAPGTR